MVIGIGRQRRYDAARVPDDVHRPSNGGALCKANVRRCGSSAVVDIQQGWPRFIIVGKFTVIDEYLLDYLMQMDPTKTPATAFDCRSHFHPDDARWLKPDARHIQAGVVQVSVGL